MKKLKLDDGLLLTDLELVFKGQTLFLSRVLVDTGSGSTIVSTDKAESIGIVAEENDMIYRISGVGGSEFVYSKEIDMVTAGGKTVSNFPIEFGAMDYGFDLDGIIGLDLLQQIKAVIDLDKLTLNCD